MSSRSVRLLDYSTSPSLATNAAIPEEEEPFAPHSEDATDDGEDTLQEGHGVSVIPNDTAHLEWDAGIPVSGSWRSFSIRALALLCAMSLSIGSHFGSYFLGPLKSRLSREIGTSNAEFSLMIAAFNLNSTWTPLIGGLLAARLGTALSSIIATSLILLGQIILLLGDIAEDVALMAVGLFVFGLGISPLAVVQESIIVRFFASHGLGVSLALGLVAGKGASFASARLSYPLAESYGPHAPFILATLLALFSFNANLVYLTSSAWFARGVGVELDAHELEQERRRRKITPGERMSAAEAVTKVAAKKAVHFIDLKRFGDIFWLYIGINLLCGAIWSPFTHLASNIIEQRYNLTEAEASNQASLLLAGSLFLYPICGYLTDRLKHGSVVFALFTLSSALTLICYTWLALPPALTRTPLPAMLAFGCGHGFSTLLLVIIVPHIVPLAFVSTALGAHKSIEQAGSTISQTLAGLILDIRRVKRSAGDNLSTLVQNNDPQSIQLLLICYLIINLLQLAGTLLLWNWGARHKRRQARRASAAAAEYEPIVSTIEESEEARGTGATTAVVSSDDDDGVVGPSVAVHMHTEGSWAGRTRPLMAPPSPTLHKSSLLPHQHRHARYLLDASQRRSTSRVTTAESRRGRVAVVVFIGVVLFTWTLFMGTAVMELRRGGSDKSKG